jgi:uncharacterized protein YgfB (UPF0149 family)
MDPNATLRDIRTAYAEKDWQTLFDRADSLAQWLNGGGFPPTGMTRGKADELAANYAYTARMYLRDGGN